MRQNTTIFHHPSPKEGVERVLGEDCNIILIIGRTKVKDAKRLDMAVMLMHLGRYFVTACLAACAHMHLNLRGVQ